MNATVQALAQANYPRNCWWVAARSSELQSQPLARWLLDTPVVLFRTETGEAKAIYDRCPHRWAPLSRGWVEGENLVCAYHGARMGEDGVCRSYPTQPAVPAEARVSAFAVVEHGPFIWIWMGDEDARAAADLPPDFSWYGDPSYSVFGGHYEMQANYIMMHENVMDLTHFNYLHANSFKVQNWPTPKFEIDGDRVGFRQRHVVEELPADMRRQMMVADEHAFRIETQYFFETPAYHSVQGVIFRRPNKEIPEEVCSYICHIVTPISPTKTHYWWIAGNSMPLPEPDRSERLAIHSRLFEQAFDEDKQMLEAIQRLVAEDPRGRDFPEVTFKGDRGGLLVRATVERLIAAERMADHAAVGED